MWRRWYGLWWLCRSRSRSHEKSKRSHSSSSHDRHHSHGCSKRMHSRESSSSREHLRRRRSHSSSSRKRARRSHSRSRHRYWHPVRPLILFILSPPPRAPSLMHITRYAKPSVFHFFKKVLCFSACISIKSFCRGPFMNSCLWCCIKFVILSLFIYFMITWKWCNLLPVLWLHSFWLWQVCGNYQSWKLEGIRTEKKNSRENLRINTLVDSKIAGATPNCEACWGAWQMTFAGHRAT